MGGEPIWERVLGSVDESESGQRVWRSLNLCYLWVLSCWESFLSQLELYVTGSLSGSVLLPKHLPKLWGGVLRCRRPLYHITEPRCGCP